jgi:hypothetical protein
MYVPYEILRNLAPAGLTVVQQREADDQLGRIAAGLMRRGRAGGRTGVCTGSDTGVRGWSHGRISKFRRDAARPAGRVVRPAA